MADIAKFKVPVPPFQEQQKIAKILSTWDKAISTTERLIENSTQQKKALMQQLLTGKKRLLDDEGKRFESEWEEVRLDEVVSIGRGHAFKSEQYSEYGYKIVRVTNIDSSGNIDLTDCVSIPENTAKEFSKYELKDEDILLVMVGATVGKLGFVDDSILPALLNQNMWSLRTSNSQILYQEFLKHISSYIIARYMLTQQGSARGFFTQSTFSLVKFSIPNIKEQEKIATVLTNADKDIELLEQQLADLQQEKKALMQVLLTGKKRVIVEEVA
ncbi:restriction endonuclease subunit S [Psychrobacter okhotskensis]|uniref:restriction endonuclease subunit S n=1 Tax=Psychrobacter okhotskensis TaxID=212403 RepID=UPI001565157B|nr:restriction endonuclease subunit S [Psychrobacter okhotskensis]